MGRLVQVATLLSVWLLVASPVTSDESLTMRVSAFAPASLTVQLVIKTDRQNRALAVIAEAPDFYRSSQIQLDGEHAPRTTVFELRGLPPDMYEVTGILIGPKSPRARVIQIARVLPELMRR